MTLPDGHQSAELSPILLHRSQGYLGLIFEVLIRKFAEASNETAGEHFTPREVIRLTMHPLFVEYGDVLTHKPQWTRTFGVRGHAESGCREQRSSSSFHGACNREIIAIVF